MTKLYPSHRNCTCILPGKLRPDSPIKWMRERTHGCWCSSWKLLKGGQFRIWRKGKWMNPDKGEVRFSPLPPAF